MLRTKKKLNYEDYASLDDGKRYELFDGELYMTPSPNVYHQTVSANLFDFLRDFNKKEKLGTVLCAPLDVVFTEHDVVQPDILFISDERKEIITEKNIQGAPDLVVEILSAGTQERDKIVKKNLYERYGVREYWIADPVAKNVEILSLKEKGFEFFGKFFIEEELSSPLLEGLEIPLSEVFVKR